MLCNSAPSLPANFVTDCAGTRLPEAQLAAVVGRCRASQSAGSFLIVLSFFFFCQEKRKYEPPVPTRVGKRKKKSKGPDAANKLPTGE